jgi:hypothetical protein
MIGGGDVGDWHDLNCVSRIVAQQASRDKRAVFYLVGRRAFSSRTFQ